MNKLFFSGLALSLLSLGACQNNKEEKTEDPKVLSHKAIEIHDEIMPQISSFDKNTVLIDSLLGDLSAVKAAMPDLDTTNTRQELATLKTDLESATDKMMTWMKEYKVDNDAVDYQKSEVDRISDLKAEFEKVGAEANRLLAPFNK